MGALTKDEVNAVIIAERVAASISLCCTGVQIVTFIFNKEFRTIGNKLIFYASLANIFANVAALIGGSALTKVNSALCQFQGFLLEMFMMSDPLWSCAMSINVFLVFFRRFREAELKQLLWKYALVCYGIPFIPAVFCLVYKTKAKGHMYGNATLWCWIDNDWGSIRIYSYYAPIWATIVVSTIIYILVGIKLNRTRKNLHQANAENLVALRSYDDSYFGSGSPFTGVRTTEVNVTTSPSFGSSIISPAATHQRPEGHQSSRNHGDNYSVIISSNSSSRLSPMYRPSKHSFFGDEVQILYCKIAMLFALSVFITWIPASINRIYGLVYPDTPSFGLSMASALVLPLQGFWNTVIFFATSKQICISTWRRWMGKQRWSRVQANGVHVRDRQGSESTTELKSVRARTHSHESFHNFGSVHTISSSDEEFI